jgi:putative effector of murein hydrolase LrgA (UPF0299 family)
MSQVPSRHPRESGKTAMSSSLPNRVPRPRLPKAIVGLVVLFVVLNLPMVPVMVLTGMG